VTTTLAALRLIDDWDAPTAAAGVVLSAGNVARRGAIGQPMRLASVTKLLVTYAILVALEEGTVALDEPAGPAGATLRHLLAHASGLDFDSDRIVAPVGRRRIYSNTGFEVAAAVLEQSSGMSWAAYVHEAVCAPLGMAATVLGGSPASGGTGPLDDLLRFGRELLSPSLIAADTLREATSVQFPGLQGILPGVGPFAPNDWGLGFERRDSKSPHWTGTRNSPATFGHFGASGTFLWVDPAAGVALASVSGRDFDRWALDAWPVLSDAVLSELSEPSEPSA
jgi:CubicO group peptidase (beta-lactamase class C family)